MPVFRIRIATRFIVVIAAIVVAHPRGVSAQQRAYQGTFEGAGADSARRVLGASFSIAGGYDRLPQLEAPVGLADQFQLPGLFVTMLPMATFQSKGKQLNMSATAGTNGRYYNEVQRLVAVNHYATASIGVQITPRTDLFIGQSISYSPAYLNRIFSTLGPSNALDPSTTLDPSVSTGLDARTTDEGLSGIRSYASGTTVNLTRKFGRRAGVTLTGGSRYTHFVNDDPDIPDLRGFEGGGYFSYSLNRDVSLRFGYQYREAHFAPLQMSAEQLLDVGFGWTHVSSPTRRTTFAINAGPRAVKTSSPPRTDALDPTTPAAATANTPQVFAVSARTPQVSVVAGALLDHQMGQTWTVHGGFHRDVAYIEAIRNPVFTNTMDLMASGYLSRRVDLAASFGHSYGDSSFSIGVPSPFRAYNGNLRIRVALGKRWAGYTEYVYDSYEFEGTLPIPSGIASRMTRSGIRLGLMLWIPVARSR